MLRRKFLLIIIFLLAFQVAVYAEDLQQYVLGPGDILEVTVWNHPDLQQKAVIRPDGMVSLLLVGDLQVKGLTPLQMAETVTESLKKFINTPQVNVAVIEFKKIEVSVLGAISRSGTMSIVPNTRLLDVLATAGIDNEKAFLEEVTLTRNFTVMKIDVARLLTEGGHQNYILQSGDVIYVPEIVRQVYILGEVVRPGAYEIDKMTTPADLLAMAGGPTKLADLEKVMIIHRNGEIGEETINLKEFLKNQKSSTSMPILRNGDIIQVAEKKTIDWEKVFLYAAGIKTIHDLIVNW